MVLKFNGQGKRWCTRRGSVITTVHHWQNELGWSSKGTQYCQLIREANLEKRLLVMQSINYHSVGQSVSELVNACTLDGFLRNVPYKDNNNQNMSKLQIFSFRIPICNAHPITHNQQRITMNLYQTNLYCTRKDRQFRNAENLG